MKWQNSIHYWHYIALATLINASNNICLTLASLRGGHNDPPGKNLRDSFVCNLFHTPIPEKKDEWTKKMLPSKKMEKNIYEGVPRITELGQNLKKYFQKYQFAGWLSFHHMKR
mgnify:CR=1 FL=1